MTILIDRTGRARDARGRFLSRSRLIQAFRAGRPRDARGRFIGPPRSIRTALDPTVYIGRDGRPRDALGRIVSRKELDRAAAAGRVRRGRPSRPGRRIERARVYLTSDGRYITATEQPARREEVLRAHEAGALWAGHPRRPRERIDVGILGDVGGPPVRDYRETTVGAGSARTTRYEGILAADVAASAPRAADAMREWARSRGASSIAGVLVVETNDGRTFALSQVQRVSIDDLSDYMIGDLWSEAADNLDTYGSDGADGAVGYTFYAWGWS